MTNEIATTEFTILEFVEVTPANESDLGDTISVWQPRGVQAARDRDQALRLFFADTTVDVDGMFVAVSAAAWNPKKVSITLKPAISIV